MVTLSVLGIIIIKLSSEYRLTKFLSSFENYLENLCKSKLIHK